MQNFSTLFHVVSEIQAVIHGWGTASPRTTKFCADFGLLYFLNK